eukprot:TRINITY_DN42803_c0_g1_i1.p1 TRINITY_DN42803_c0_g1~~TRINITY_DN42803_c0_g1_i1.p1  ORF type:complete len:849 (-),score=131.05 TRINITY_DN42803_c0_g1_i1:93-2639(-)
MTAQFFCGRNNRFGDFVAPARHFGGGFRWRHAVQFFVVVASVASLRVTGELLLKVSDGKNVDDSVPHGMLAPPDKDEISIISEVSDAKNLDDTVTHGMLAPPDKDDTSIISEVSETKGIGDLILGPNISTIIQPAEDAAGQSIMRKASEAKQITDIVTNIVPSAQGPNMSNFFEPAGEAAMKEASEAKKITGIVTDIVPNISNFIEPAEDSAMREASEDAKKIGGIGVPIVPSPQSPLPKIIEPAEEAAEASIRHEAPQPKPTMKPMPPRASRSRRVIAFALILSLLLNVFLVTTLCGRFGKERYGDEVLRPIDRIMRERIQGSVCLENARCVNPRKCYLTVLPCLVPSSSTESSPLDLWQDGFLARWPEPEDFESWRQTALPAPEASMPLQNLVMVRLEPRNSEASGKVSLRHGTTKDTETDFHLFFPTAEEAYHWVEGLGEIMKLLGHKFIVYTGSNSRDDALIVHAKKPEPITMSVVDQMPFSSGIFAPAWSEEDITTNPSDELFVVRLNKCREKRFRHIMARGVAVLVLVLGIGISFGTLRMRWTLTETVYFLASTLSTTGYGDLTFNSHYSPTDRVIGAFYVFGSVVYFGTLALFIHAWLFRHREAQRSGTRENWRFRQTNVDAREFFEEKKQELYVEAVLGFIQIIAVWSFGAVAMNYLENWDPSAGFYWASCTLTTVGYGDMIPTSDVSRWFVSVFLVLNFFIVTHLMAFLGRLPFDLSALEDQYLVLNQFTDTLSKGELDSLYFSEALMCLRSADPSATSRYCRCVSMAEFVLCQLVKMEKINLRFDVLPCMSCFAKLDLNHDGILGKAEVGRLRAEIKHAKMSAANVDCCGASLNMPQI